MHKHIRRCPVGWVVKRWFPDRLIQPYFSDRVWGGYDESLAAAEREVKRLDELYGSSGHWLGYKRYSSKNRSGVVGIHLVIKMHPKKTTLYVSSFYGGYKQQRRYVPIKKHGLYMAFVTCWNWRRWKLELPIDFEARDQALRNLLDNLEHNELLQDFAELRDGVRDCRRILQENSQGSSHA